MDIIKKHKNQIEYNEFNEFIDDQVLPNTVPKRQKLSEDGFTTNKKTVSTDFCTPSQRQQQMPTPKAQSQTSTNKKRLEKLKSKNEQLRKRLHEKKSSLKQFQKRSSDYTVTKQKNYVTELLKQHVSLLKIIERNKKNEGVGIPVTDKAKLKLPFILIRFLPESDVSITQDELLQ